MSNISPFKHDISHCSGSDVRLLPYGGTQICDCSLKRFCYRYQAYCDPEGKVIKVYDARSQFCRCIYAVGFDSEGYEEWKTIYTIETKDGHRRKHHADRMIKYLKEDFYGRLGSTATLNGASKALMQKHKIEVFDGDNPLTKKLEEESCREKFTATIPSNTMFNKKS